LTEALAGSGEGVMAPSHKATEETSDNLKDDELTVGRIQSNLMEESQEP